MKQLINQVLDNMQLIQSYIMGLKNTMLAKHNLGRACYGILNHLQHNGEISGKDLAAQLGVTTSAVTQLIEGLEEDKLITRKVDRMDKRVILLSLSKKGENLFKSLKKELSKNLADVLADSTEEELKIFIKFQTKMLANLSKKKQQSSK